MMFSTLSILINYSLCLDYLVQLNPEVSISSVEQSSFYIEEADKIQAKFQLGNVKGFHMKYSSFPSHLYKHSFVKTVEEDHKVSVNSPENVFHQTGLQYNGVNFISETFNNLYEANEINEKKSYFLQTDPVWSLDAIDQSSKNLDNRYFYRTSGGSNVNVFIVDTGIDTKHPEFQGRAIWGFNSADKVDTDCNGHGTHVAGTVGSVNYGLAKKTRLVAVKVLACNGSGSYSGVIAGLEYVLKTSKRSKIPSVANMSLGGPKSKILNEALKELVDNGVHVIVAAGNENSDACNTSPASEPSVMTVGASSHTYEMAGFSNWGKCVDVLAPGTKITSTLPGNKVGELQGTSMASPAQAGVYALILSENPTFSPDTMKKVTDMTCAKNIISKMKIDTPNCLIQSIV